MRTRMLARWAVALAVALAWIGTALGRGHADAPLGAADPAAKQGFPWLCPVASLAALVGLYVLVRRREREVEADRKRGRGPENTWYCRECDRDVSGPECPRCRAPNPFHHEPADQPEDRRSARNGR